MSEGDRLTESKWVFSVQEAVGLGKDVLGSKGSELAEMTAMGLPVPPGFTITTQAGRAYYEAGNAAPVGLWEQVRRAIGELEASTGSKFADETNPLLVSVRSGAAVSMPGMMDTVLNLGINEQIVEAIAKRTGNERFALDLYRRFLQMYGSVVLGIDDQSFHERLEHFQHAAGVERSADLDPTTLREVVAESRRIVESAGSSVHEDPWVQLEHAVLAVFDSWNSRRAIAYKEFHGIPHDLYTAVNVVSMVYGNVDDNSASGVLFTRDPSTGDKGLYGEYLVNAQGEDVVAGTTTPRDLACMVDEMPDIYHELVGVAGALEGHYRDVQDIEFTVEQGRLYILQTRVAKRSAAAAIKSAVDMVHERLIDTREAVMRVEPDQVYQALLPRFDEEARRLAEKEGRLLARGLGASPGAATGKLVFDSDVAVDMGESGDSVILALTETRAEDVHGMMAASGVLTARGGATSHAAVVARGLGKACVTAIEAIQISPQDGILRCGEVTLKTGDEVSIDGATGEFFVGTLATERPRTRDEGDMMQLLDWADGIRRLGIRANADHRRDAVVARDFGAEGIGLCRTEHMFFEPERLSLVRQMILAARKLSLTPEDGEARETYDHTLAELEQHQVSDFEGMFRAMEGRPVTIRLLDPPLHEFLPKHDELVADLQMTKMGTGEWTEKQDLVAAVDDMRETNPMLGLRGSRLGIVYPAIYEMQTRAILQAARRVSDDGFDVEPEIMVPLVSHVDEIRAVRRNIEDTIESFNSVTSEKYAPKIGVMIETPRAALTADEIAQCSDFFSFGTNDLTQMTFAFSRDDAEGKFLSRYLEMGILDKDPFVVIDRRGVVGLVQTACELGRKIRPDLALGACGEHGADPDSVDFFHQAGLDYVSCSPYRVPGARLSAAQAALRDEVLNINPDGKLK